MLRQRVREGTAVLGRHDGRRIGVVTGTAMAPLMPPLLDTLRDATGASFELLPVVNSLFGPTTTTAGLLTSADIMGALAGRVDLDFAMIPAECVNERRQFLDDRQFDDVCDALPMPVALSYDFIDVLRDAAQ
jgi:hypothetical protein